MRRVEGHLLVAGLERPLEEGHGGLRAAGRQAMASEGDGHPVRRVAAPGAFGQEALEPGPRHVGDTPRFEGAADGRRLERRVEAALELAPEDLLEQGDALPAFPRHELERGLAVTKS